MFYCRGLRNRGGYKDEVYISGLMKLIGIEIKKIKE